MGYKNKKYQKDLTQQINDRLTQMLHAGAGTSKRDAIADGTDRDKIFSYSTYDSYFKHCKYFSRYVRENHPEAKSLKQAKKYVNEWLQTRVDQVDKNGNHLSAWTITLEREALGKLYGIKPDDKDFFPAPQRHREDIKRSRGDAVRDRHFSERNNDEFVKFCRGTGCRRNIIEKLKGSDLITREEIELEVTRLEAIIEAIIKAKEKSEEKKEPLTPEEKSEEEKKPLTPEEKQLVMLKDALELFPDQDYYIYNHRDKGGRDRCSPIIGEYKQQIVDRMKATAPDEKVWQHVPTMADIHGYRGDYATAIYKLYARPIEEIPYDRTNKGTGKKFQSGVYVCRKDESGKKLDKEAMLKASKALGHNRLEIVANNYIRGL